ncbi:MAG: tetratricopeptide repeat protein [Candidatus Omnitrophica bacterium]|nr:tetratricopeptide repeat protein [Candidatus Omnitrophota bacterium]
MAMIKKSEAYLKSGKTYCVKKKYALAIADFNKSIELENKIEYTASAHHWLGYAYFQLGKYSEGIANHREATRLDPGAVIYYTDWAIDCINTKKYDEAIHASTAGIKHNRTKHTPEGALLYAHRGLAYEEKGEYRKAINDFKKAIEFDPAFKGYRSNLNRVLQKAK